MATEALRVHMHVTRDACEFPQCDSKGFHFHWRGKSYTTAFGGVMTPEEFEEFDADCTHDNKIREAERERKRRGY